MGRGWAIKYSSMKQARDSVWITMLSGWRQSTTRTPFGLYSAEELLHGWLSLETEDVSCLSLWVLCEQIRQFLESVYFSCGQILSFDSLSNRKAINTTRRPNLIPALIRELRKGWWKNITCPSMIGRLLQISLDYLIPYLLFIKGSKCKICTPLPEYIHKLHTEKITTADRLMCIHPNTRLLTF